MNTPAMPTKAELDKERESQLKQDAKTSSTFLLTFGTYFAAAIIAFAVLYMVVLYAI